LRDKYNELMKWIKRHDNEKLWKSGYDKFL
jgi:hypothetical protein